MIVEAVVALLVAVLAWLAVDGLRARETAVDAARHACASAGVQLLDDTVMLESIRIARDDDGRVTLRRAYCFEFSDTGNNRLAGIVSLAGARVAALELGPQSAADVTGRSPLA